jgi:hypothetical protein
MSTLPPLYAGWMEKVLPGTIPSESRATCDKCAMCARSDERPGSDALFFDPHVKCCSYLPVLHNFLVGGILADEDPALSQGRASVEARLEARIEVTPLGLGRSAPYDLLYTHAKEAFGISRNLRCPHYIDEEGGRCGIWRHRNAVCTTWFCKHERGAIGLKFWRTLLQLLSRVEVGLSRWCVLELDIGTRALESLFPIGSANREPPKLNAKQIDQVADLEAHRLRWGKWLGREREFYRECARLVDDLSWEDIARICGPEVLVFTKLVQEAYDRLTSNQMPEIVRLQPVHIMGMGQDWVQVTAYSGNDPLKLPRKLLEVLPYLQSQPIAEALQAVQREKGLRLSLDVVRKLIDFDILAAAPETERLDFADGA